MHIRNSSKYEGLIPQKYHIEIHTALWLDFQLTGIIADCGEIGLAPASKDEISPLVAYTHLEYSLASNLLQVE